MNSSKASLLVERLFDVECPVGAIVDGFSSYALWIAAALLMMSLPSLNNRTLDCIAGT
jgi:hypothetical protein